MYTITYSMVFPRGGAGRPSLILSLHIQKASGPQHLPRPYPGQTCNKGCKDPSLMQSLKQQNHRVGVRCSIHIYFSSFLSYFQRVRRQSLRESAEIWGMCYFSAWFPPYELLTWRSWRRCSHFDCATICATASWLPPPPPLPSPTPPTASLKVWNGMTGSRAIIQMICRRD